MGELIVLALNRRESHGSSPDTREQSGAGMGTVFYFDLACPFSYLAAERVERLLGDIEWVPAPARLLDPRPWVPGAPSAQTTAERRARSLRLPLVWPAALDAGGFPGAMRAASHASEEGRTRQFALAAMRLAFCGGYDLERQAVVAEAAAVAGLDVESCLASMRDGERDQDLEHAARMLSSANVRRLPAVRVGERWLDGEQAVAQAAAIRRASSGPTPSDDVVCPA